MDVEPFIALNRFGLGRRAGEGVPADPRGWLLGQLAGADPGLESGAFRGLPEGAACLARIRAAQRERKRLVAANGGKPPKGYVPDFVRIFRAEARAALGHAIATPAPFRERLVWFWANHFTVSTRQGGTIGMVGAYLREAIRPHVTGRFEDMLRAVMQHPGMLMYLDNAFSVGPDSRLGRRTHRGLNENLARESLELHTVSLAGGYSQADVTNYARILTGWSIAPNRPPTGFLFRPFAHEPGSQEVMGRRFAPGEEGGLEMLRFLAQHPATHQHLARQLCRHFVADDPPAGAVARIAGVLSASGGDLGAAARALVALPEAWRAGTKLRRPMGYAVAALRLLDPPWLARALPFAMLGSLRLLGQPLWAAPLPNGWSDTAADWSGSGAVMRRADWAFTLAGRVPHAEPAHLAEYALGPLLRPATLLAVGRAGSRRDGLTLLLSAPEFQRR